jgi:type I restriction enzyme R subunit
MLAVSSIPNAIRYKRLIDKHFKDLVEQKKYERFKEAPIYIVYSDSQDQPSSNSVNDGINEKQVLQNFKLAKNGLIIVVDKLQTGFDEPKLHTLFLDKEIRGINAIQTISRVNRTTKYKNDCKIIDFSYKNVNVKNIKQAFEHFSNVVVSDFDPLGDEERLDIYLKELKDHDLFKTHFKAFQEYNTTNDDINLILAIDNDFTRFIMSSKKEAKKLKQIINDYFKILNLIEFVIEIDKKYSEELFLQFWRKFSIIYGQINKGQDDIDDVEIYFDNKIGIVAPQDYKVKEKNKVKGVPNGSDDNKYKYNIIKVIEKRNQEEEAIAELIEDFENKIDAFFTFIKADEMGKRLIAKIKDDGSAFSQDEIYTDFNKLYRKYTIMNKDLGEFFKRETKDILNQLCDDFERNLN